jgi:uncharacterized protein (DUF433 family)
MEGDPNRASIPFIGLAEAYTLHAFRALGVPLQRIRPALERLREEVGLDHALASQKLYTDGAEVLYEYGQESGDEAVASLVVVRQQQPVFRDVVAGYLKKITYDQGYAQRLPLTGYTGADVYIDPRLSIGQPVFATGGVRVADALDLFRAGEPMETVSQEYGVPLEDLEAVLRASLVPADIEGHGRQPARGRPSSLLRRPQSRRDAGSFPPPICRLGSHNTH